MKSDEELERLIKEDNVEELTIILNSNDIIRNNFNTFLCDSLNRKIPILHFAVEENSQKVVEYLLSQDFVDKSIVDTNNENIYHVICGIRGAEELFSIIERKVPHLLLLHNTMDGINAFDIACKENNIFIVKRVHEILETLQQVDLTSIINNAMKYAIIDNDIEVIKYVSPIDKIQLLFEKIRNLPFNIVVHSLNIYLCQSIPSHLRNQFHIFQFSNLHYNNYKNNYNDNDQSNNYYYLTVVENFKKIINIKIGHGNRIWHQVRCNKDMDVVQLILSLKGIQAEIFNDKGYNVFLQACGNNSNLKVIKYIHKLFPSFIHSQMKSKWHTNNGAHLIISNYQLYDQLNSSD